MNRLQVELHPAIRERVAGVIHPPSGSSDAELIASAIPFVEQAERTRELEVVGRIENGAGPGGGSATGPGETLTALQTGQVMVLAMNDDYAAPGWADFTFPIYGVGNPPAEHPSGGDAGSLTPVALEEELVRLAIQQGADIEIVRGRQPVSSGETVDSAASGQYRTEAAKRLDRLSGVGAILRYALSDARSTAHL